VNYLATALLGLSQTEGCTCRRCLAGGKLRSEEHVMTRNLLTIAVLSAAIGLAVSSANAAPATSMLEALKADASQGAIVQETRYRHRRSYRNVRSPNCWWGDRWLCRYFW
jgi:hypothetical protein